MAYKRDSIDSVVRAMRALADDRASWDRAKRGPRRHTRADRVDTSHKATFWHTTPGGDVIEVFAWCPRPWAGQRGVTMLTWRRNGAEIAKFPVRGDATVAAPDWSAVDADQVPEGPVPDDPHRRRIAEARARRAARSGDANHSNHQQ